MTYRSRVQCVCLSGSYFEVNRNKQVLFQEEASGHSLVFTMADVSTAGYLHKASLSSVMN